MDIEQTDGQAPFIFFNYNQLALIKGLPERKKKCLPSCLGSMAFLQPRGTGQTVLLLATVAGPRVVRSSVGSWGSGEAVTAPGPDVSHGIALSGSPRV